MQLANACKPDAQPVEFRLCHVQQEYSGKLASDGGCDSAATTKTDRRSRQAGCRFEVDPTATEDAIASGRHNTERLHSRLEAGYIQASVLTGTENSQIINATGLGHRSEGAGSMTTKTEAEWLQI